MSQSLEDLIRAAQHQQAERAVHPQRVLAALPQRRARAARRQRLVLAVTAAAVAAVVAVPVFALRQGAAAPQPPSATPGPRVSPAVTGLVPLKYSPGWLPAGYAEYHRTARSPARVIRAWSAAPPRPGPGLNYHLLLTGTLWMTVGATEDEPKATAGETVDINGVSGRYSGGDSPGVTWQLGGFTIDIGTEGPVLSRDTMLRIARSVRPDPTAMELPLTVRLPAGTAITDQSVEGVSAGEWFARTELGEPGTGRMVFSGTWIGVGTLTRAPAGGTALRVAGHPARYVPPKAPEAAHFLVLDLGDGLKLTVASLHLDQPAMVALAEAADTPNPGVTGWIGS